MYLYKDTGLAWLKERGFESVKVNCEAGDLVLCTSLSPSAEAKPKLTLTHTSRRGQPNNSLQRCA